MWSMLAGVLALATLSAAQCTRPLTTVSGKFAPNDFCAGDLIFNDEFDEFDVEKWQHEITLSGGGVSILVSMYFFLVLPVKSLK